MVLVEPGLACAIKPPRARASLTKKGRRLVRTSFPGEFREPETSIFFCFSYRLGALDYDISSKTGRKERGAHIPLARL